jgi:ADP-ribose pyrophosphatase YjhB (NUDIX family)
MKTEHPQHKNPVPAVDFIIEKDSKILLIRRKNEPFKGMLSIPGGFINEGETAEEAMKREAREETMLETEPIQILGVYSDPKRDLRMHTLSITFIARPVGGSEKASDDASSVEWFDLADLDSDQKLAFDHAKILADFKRWLKTKETFWSSKQ